MAKLGEGDERWIVRERDDGRNVNNWHWSETNLTEWAREKLEARLQGIVLREDARGVCKILSLDTMKGDVSVQSRKQKRFPLYAAASAPAGPVCSTASTSFVFPIRSALTHRRWPAHPRLQVRARAHNQLGGPAVGRQRRGGGGGQGQDQGARPVRGDF